MARSRGRLSRRRRGSKAKSVFLTCLVVAGLCWGTYVLIFDDSSSSEAASTTQTNTENTAISGDQQEVKGTKSPEKSAQSSGGDVASTRALISKLQASLSGKRGVELDEAMIKAHQDFSRYLEGELSQEARKMAIPAFNALTEQLIFSPEFNTYAERYVVQSGDSLDKIAKKFGVTQKLICKWNNIVWEERNNIRVNTTFKVITGPARVVVDKSEFFLNYYLGDKLAKQYLIAHGERNITPERTFTIVTKQEHPDELPNASVMQLEMDERWMGFNDFDDGGQKRGGFGIHGTKYEDSIGQRSSHGCVRMYNKDVVELYDMLPRRAEVQIRA